MVDGEQDFKVKKLKKTPANFPVRRYLREFFKLGNFLQILLQSANHKDIECLKFRFVFCRLLV